MASTDIRVGDAVLYRPLGSTRAALPRTVLAIRQRVYGRDRIVTRAKIGTGPGGWVNIERLEKAS